MIRTTRLLFKNAIVDHPSVPVKNLTRRIKSDPPNPWFILSALLFGILVSKSNNFHLKK